MGHKHSKQNKKNSNVVIPHRSKNIPPKKDSSQYVPLVVAYWIRAVHLYQHALSYNFMICIVTKYVPNMDGFKILSKEMIHEFEFLKVVGGMGFDKAMDVRRKVDAKCYSLIVIKKKALKTINQISSNNIKRSKLADIDHPFITSLRFACQSDKKLYLIYDQFDRKFSELNCKPLYPSKANEKTIMFYSAQIYLGIDYLHQNGYIYRDLEPRNIFIDNNGYIKITDFNIFVNSVNDNNELFHIFDHENCTRYIAPEILDIEYNGYNYMVDWWSFGMILYDLLIEYDLMKDSDCKIEIIHEYVINKGIKNANYLSVDSADLLRKLLVENPNKRINGKQIKLHPFLNSIHWDKLYNKEIINEQHQQMKNVNVNNTYTFDTSPGFSYQ